MDGSRHNHEIGSRADGAGCGTDAGRGEFGFAG